MRTPTPLILLSTLAVLLLAVPASASKSAAASVKRFPSGARVGTISATAKRSSKTVTVHVTLSLKAPKGQWRAGVLVSLVCGDRSLSGAAKTVRFTGRGTKARVIGASIKVPAGTCAVQRRVVASVLVSRTTVGAATWARGQTALRAR
jgi:hypothetical protein